MNNPVDFNDQEMNESPQLYPPKIIIERTEQLSPVVGHTSAIYRGCLLIYGGYYFNGNQLGYRDTEDLYVYPYGLTGDFDVWLKVKCTGKLPKFNCGSSTLINGDNLFVFGGTTALSENAIQRRTSASSTLYKLDLKTGVWQLVTVPIDEKVPTPRDKMAAWTVGNKLYYFAGYGSPLSRLENPENYLFDSDDYKEGVERGVWNNQLLEYDISRNKWSLIPKLGDVPSQRAACAACYVPDLHVVFLFGGRHHLRRLNDLYRLDKFSMRWTKIEVNEDVPIGRSWCTFVHLADRKLIVMQGGYSCDCRPLDDIWHLDLSELYDLNKRRNGTANVRWICVRPLTEPAAAVGEVAPTQPEEEPSPFRRYWHTANVIRSPMGNLSEVMLVYGGFNGDLARGGTCLNTLSTQRLSPSTLFTISMQNLQRDQLLPLPSEFSILNLKRKVVLLEELRRFKQQKNSYPHLNESHHYSHCPSLHNLALGEIFDILDSNVV